jgi:hypothetical protein
MSSKSEALSSNSPGPPKNKETKKTPKQQLKNLVTPKYIDLLCIFNSLLLSSFLPINLISP